MSGRESFDDALDAAIDEIRSGAALDAVLAAHPRHADALRPLLETSVGVRNGAIAMAAPMSHGLADNFTIVRAALERERMSATASERAPGIERTPWWARRWTVASLSLPIGAVLFVLAGAGSAAAATVAVTNPDAASRVVSIVTPEWAQEIVPAALRDDAGGSSVAEPTATGGAEGSDEPRETPGIVSVTVDGTIGDVRGNTFTLQTSEDAWNVQVDANTEVSGGIVEGAAATASGSQTGGKTLHADAVSTDAPAEPTSSPGNGNGPGENSSGGDNNGNGNGPDGNSSGGNNNGNGNGPDGNSSGGNNNGNGNGSDGNSSGGNNNGNGNGPDENSAGGNNQGNGNGPGQNSSGNGNENSNAGGNGQGSVGGNSPPGQGNSPSGGGGGQGSGNAGGSSSGGNGNAGAGNNSGNGNSNGNGGGPKKKP